MEFKEKSYSKEQRKILCEVLEKQLENLQLSDKQKENLQALSQENTFTIVTGHQLNLFTGPAFFVYKILQTIKTTDFLNQNIQKSGGNSDRNQSLLFLKIRLSAVFPDT